MLESFFSLIVSIALDPDLTDIFTDTIREYLVQHDVQGRIAEAVSACVQTLPSNVDLFMAEYFAAKTAVHADLVLEAHSIFAKADINSDGKLTKQELKDYLIKTPKLKQILLNNGGWSTMFAQIDGDNNAEFDANEFATFYEEKVKAAVGKEGLVEAHHVEALHEVDENAKSKKNKKKEKKAAGKEETKAAAPAKEASIHPQTMEGQHVETLLIFSLSLIHIPGDHNNDCLLVSIRNFVTLLNYP